MHAATVGVISKHLMNKIKKITFCILMDSSFWFDTIILG